MDTLASMNNTDSKQLDIKTIPPGDLKDPEPEEVVKRGKITKKLLKGIEPVASWNQEPSLRQNMPFFLNQLTCLYRNHYSPKIPPRCRSSSNSSINSSLGREILLELDDDDLSLDTLNLDDIEQVGDPLKAAEFLKYLEKAAFHENQAALYNLGNIYYEGKLGLPRNQKQAIMNYKKAALKGHDKSIDKLKSLKINVYDD
ncbi:1637_t:CDS:2 [Entrophospora sp. SA101]|nr:1637_t:CDS:2 [Entrophospora sp. SA101]